ncbi:MAG: cytochrome c maturation protein CcmE, partial [Pseudomonadota bacterium]
MTPKQQRMLSVGMLLVGLVVVSALSIGALRENTGFYLELDEVAAGEFPTDRRFRVGGLVAERPAGQPWCQVQPDMAPD